MYIIGVDPGIGKIPGAIAVTHNGEFVSVHDMPVRIKALTRKRVRECDVVACAELLTDILSNTNPDDSVYGIIEEATVRPHQEISGAVRYIGSDWVWRGLFAAFGIEYRVAHPASWKPNGDKNVSLARARERFPQAHFPYLEKKKHHGRAEALLLCEYGMKLFKDNLP